MSRLTDNQAYQRAVRDCITWLHRRADEMNDPSARSLLHSTAFNLGVDKPCLTTPETERRIPRDEPRQP